MLITGMCRSSGMFARTYSDTTDYSSLQAGTRSPCRRDGEEGEGEGEGEGLTKTSKLPICVCNVETHWPGKRMSRMWLPCWGSTRRTKGSNSWPEPEAKLGRGGRGYEREKNNNIFGVKRDGQRGPESTRSDGKWDVWRLHWKCFFKKLFY